MGTDSKKAVRLVVFMTTTQAADMPGEARSLACMLPLGTATFAERVMDSCHQAGVAQVDLVVSDQPEQLRSILKNGEPWGITLNWHYAKDAASPYRTLRGMSLNTADLIVIGHAHQWISSTVLRNLIAEESAAYQTENDLSPCGWFSMDGTELQALSPHEDYQSLARKIHARPHAQCVLADPHNYADSSTAASLLAAQQPALLDQHESAIPASWRRRPWGAASPYAIVDDNAVLHAPVLIGPGCVVEAGAIIGPNVVLTSDVFVATGARIEDALVLDNTYLSGQVDVQQSIVKGSAIKSLKWNIHTILNDDDALMMKLRTRKRQRPSALGRLSAALVMLVTSPIALVLTAVQKGTRRPLGWANKPVVTHHDEAGNPQMVDMCFAHSRHTIDRLMGAFGGLLDIVQGRRHWLGVRPRVLAEWHALSHEWQTLFSQSPVGLLYAPAWVESNHHLNVEAHAAADAYMAVQIGFLGRLRVLVRYLHKT